MEPSKGYQSSSEAPPKAPEPQKMQQPNPVEATSAPAEEKQSRGIVDRNTVRSAHPAHKAAADRKAQETSAESVEESEETPPNESVEEERSFENYAPQKNRSMSGQVEEVDETGPKRISAQEAAFLGVEVARKKIDPVKKAAEIRKQAESKVPVMEGALEAGSLPEGVKFAMKVARRWQQVPDTMSDADALAQGIITPEMLQLILTIVLSMMQDCLPNQPLMAWSRIQGYQNSKPIDRIADDIRMSWLVDRWFVRMAVARDKGDVRLLSKAIADETAASNQDTFKNVQRDMLFMTV